MLEKILMWIIIVDLLVYIILMLLSCSEDFLTFGARKMNPEWAEECDKYQSELLRFKHSMKFDQRGS